MLIREALRSAGGKRDQVLLSVKFGAQRDAGGQWIGIDNRPVAVKNSLAYSLRRLGTDHIDIYRPARLDPHVPPRSDLQQSGGNTKLSLHLKVCFLQVFTFIFSLLFQKKFYPHRN